MAFLLAVAKYKSSEFLDPSDETEFMDPTQVQRSAHLQLQPGLQPGLAAVDGGPNDLFPRGLSDPIPTHCAAVSKVYGLLK